MPSKRRKNNYHTTSPIYPNNTRRYSSAIHVNALRRIIFQAYNFADIGVAWSFPRRSVYYMWKKENDPMWKRRKARPVTLHQFKDVFTPAIYGNLLYTISGRSGVLCNFLTQYINGANAARLFYYSWRIRRVFPAELGGFTEVSGVLIIGEKVYNYDSNRMVVFETFDHYLAGKVVCVVLFTLSFS